MFTGIIEAFGKLRKVEKEGANCIFTVESVISHELKVDQSLSHNGVCLTVANLVSNNSYQVVAVPETLQRSNLGLVSTGDLINLERAMILGGRLDGHLVQGHVDQTAVCEQIKELDGSWEYKFRFVDTPNHKLIEKGSICVNGVSLTCYNIRQLSFQISIIPYTYHHTNFQNLKPEDIVNIEFDMVGKYIEASMKQT